MSDTFLQRLDNKETQLQGPEEKESEMSLKLKIAKLELEEMKRKYNNARRRERGLRNPPMNRLQVDADGWNYLRFKKTEFNGIPQQMRFYSCQFRDCIFSFTREKYNVADFAQCFFLRCTFMGDFTRCTFNGSTMTAAKFIKDEYTDEAKFLKQAMLELTSPKIKTLIKKGAKIIG